MINKRILSAFAASLFSLTLPAFAHHSISEVYDLDSTIVLTGTIERLSWVNPHAIFALRVENDAGTTVGWIVEMASASALTRRGWSNDTLADGMVVTVEGYQSLDGTLRTEARTVTLQNGEKLDANSGIWVSSGSEVVPNFSPAD